MNSGIIGQEKGLSKVPKKQYKNYGVQSEESDYSIQEIRKSQKRINKKRVTKIIHTCCIVNVNPLGGQTVTYKHMNSQTTNKDIRNIQRKAIKAAQVHNQKIVEQEKNRIAIISRVMPRQDKPNQMTLPPTWNTRQNPFGNF